MNCAECHDNFIARAEGLMDREEEVQCQAHLESCPDCRAEYEATTSLQSRLIARGQAAAQVEIVASVMRRVREQKFRPERETIMSKLLKYPWGFGLGAAAGAAAVIIALTALLTPKAFALEQVIEAYNKIRFLHVRTFPGGQQSPNEFWIKADAQGRVEKARYYLPETEDGAKLITWTPERAEVWFQNKHSFLILHTKKVAPWMQGLLEQSQPQLYMKGLLEGQKTGKIKLRVEEARGQSLIIVATNPEGLKQRISIDKSTDLITSLEWYHVKGANEVLRMRTEFCDYNEPIEESMFSLQEQLPADVRIADQLNHVTGVAQGTMTDDQAAAETVRQFFQALIEKDYKKAGLIYGGQLEQYAKAEFGAFNIAGIVSLGPPAAQTNWVKRGFCVPCALEIIQPDGQKVVQRCSPYVRPGDDETHPDRWNITGGVNLNNLPVLRDNEKYASMSSQEAARAFLEACSRKDWDEAGKFLSPLNERLRQHLGGLQILALGESFTAENYPGGLAPKNYPGRFVPYEIKLADGSVKKWNLAIRNDNPAGRWQVDGGI